MGRTWETPTLRALVSGRERAIERALPPPAPAIEEMPRRERTGSPAGNQAPALPAPVRPSPRREWRRLLSSRRSLQQAIILQELLAPPKSLRPE
ncbi:MAG: hypothetical protein ACRDJE_16415 [Dehalococcoidia bacterium]